MSQFKNTRGTRSIASFIFVFAIFLAGIVMLILGKAELSGMTILVFIMILCYYTLFSRIQKTTNYSTVLCDSRFYVFTCILMYSILPPIYCMLTLDEYGGARVRTAYNATIYTSDELFKTMIMSTLLFLGIMVGFFIREHVKKNTTYHDVDPEQIGTGNTRLFFGWLIVCVISTFLFLLPFIRGGFKIIRMGGSILDVDRTVSEGLIGRIQEVFFSPDIMTVSTVAMLYYVYTLNINQRTRRIVLSTTVALQVILAVMTTRRARALSIILCAFIIYVYWHERRNKKLPLVQISLVGIAVVFFYMLEVFMGQRQANSGIASYIRLFDGITAYDSLLRSTREIPSISMLSNIIYGMFRPIPILGKYIIQLFGMPSDAAPLYHWMAERYTTYQLGGGLAYTPQLEAYLCLGYIGCFLFGIFYGFVFAKKRSGLPNLFLTAMAFSIARGSIQVIGSLIWPFGIIGYFFYDQFLFRRIKLGGSKTSRIT